MADGVLVDNGSEADYNVSTDEDGDGRHVQRVKLAYSADGANTHVPADADGLLVNLGANNDVVINDGGNTITVDGTVAVTNTGLTELAAAIDTEVQVDVVGALPTGDNNIGNVDIASIAAGDNNIGNVDVASSALPSGASTSAKQDTIIGHVDGIEGLLTTIDGDTGTLAGAVAGTEMQVDVVAALPAGNNNIGDVDVASVVPGTGATSLGKAEDAQHASGDSGVYMLGVRDTQPAAHSNADADYESLHISDEGGLWSAEVASAFGGCDAFFTYDCDVTEEDVKTSAGSVYGWYIYNDGAAEVYVRLYNATAANTTVGSTAAKIVLPIPAGSAANMAFAPGIKFDTAICIAATTATGASDTTDTAANQVVATIFYK